MSPLKASLLSVALLSVSITQASAQSVISAQSGTIHHAEGDVLLNDEPIKMKLGIFPSVKEKGELRTAEGRAEVLLTPGAFLRMGEQSSIRMISTKLSDTIVQVLSGSVVIECAELPKDNKITIEAGEAFIVPKKAGLYRIDLDGKRLRVSAGEAEVTVAGRLERLKEKKEMRLDGSYEIASFDKKDTDELDRWSAHRDAYVAQANVASSQSMANWGSAYPMRTLGWVYDPLFGMFSFYPAGGYLMSPYGYGYYTPQTVYYYTQPYYSRGGSSSSGSWANQGSSGFVNTAASSAATTSSRAASIGSSPVASPGVVSGAPRDSGIGSGGGGAIHGGGSGGSSHH